MLQRRALPLLREEDGHVRMADRGRIAISSEHPELT